VREIVYGSIRHGGGEHAGASVAAYAENDAQVAGQSTAEAAARVAA
jgi:hypothetical protein